jgi:hypothetical protein
MNPGKSSGPLSWVKLYNIRKSYLTESIDVLKLSSCLNEYLASFNIKKVREIILYCKFVNADNDEFEINTSLLNNFSKFYNKINKLSKNNLNEELTASLDLLANCCKTDGEINWSEYIENIKQIRIDLSKNQVFKKELNKWGDSLSYIKKITRLPINIPYVQPTKLISSALDFPIEHLQFSAVVTDCLKKYHIFNIESLLCFSCYCNNQEYEIRDSLFFNEKLIKLFSYLSSNEGYNRKAEIAAKLQFLSDAISEDGSIDWIKYWTFSNFIFHHLFAKIDTIAKLSFEISTSSISSLPLGKLLLWLPNHNIITIGDFFNEISKGVNSRLNLGAVKLKSFSESIKFIIAQVDADGFLKIQLPDLNNKVISDNKSLKKFISQYKFQNIYRLSVTTRNLSLTQIHLGVVASKLKIVGIYNLFDLVSKINQGFPKIRSLGATYLSQIYKTVGAVESSIDLDGNIDWVSFSNILNFHIIPDLSKDITSGKEFIDSFESVINKLVTRCFDPIESEILKSRLLPNPLSSKTLEEIASLYSISRERVRQKETVVLNNLSGALINSEYPDLNFRFSNQFSSFWINASSYFKDVTTYPASDFINELSIIWSIPIQDLLLKLPLIYSILTNNASLPKNIKEVLNPVISNKKKPLNINGIISLRGFRSVH